MSLNAADKKRVLKIVTEIDKICHASKDPVVLWSAIRSLCALVKELLSHDIN